jgi:putative FmdB family regulatory protein
MPTYEYVCTSCGNNWEEIQKITAPALEACPKCEKATAKRQVSGGSFILKGGGWYSDLYSSAKPSAKGDKGDKGEGGGAASESGGTATKEGAAAKTETAAPAASGSSSGTKT